eukprot:Em0391g6a
MTKDSSVNVDSAYTKVVRYCARPPTKFTTKTDWELWLIRFEAYADEAKIGKGDRGKELLSLLDDEPFRLVYQNGLVESKDYSAVCECLTLRYGKTGMGLEWQIKLQCRVQRPGESLLDFAGELRMIASKAFPDWSNGQLEELVRNQFIQGLVSPTMQLQMQLMKDMPHSINDAMELARKLETAEQAQRRLCQERRDQIPASAELLSCPSEGAARPCSKGVSSPPAADSFKLQGAGGRGLTPAVTPQTKDMEDAKGFKVYCKHSGSNYTSSGGSKWKGSSTGRSVVLNIHVGGLHVDQLFLVARDLTQECLLGADFLCANGCAIDFDARSMSAGGEVVILQFNQLGPLVCDAVVMESISIPANCEFQLVATLMVDGKMCRKSNVGILEPQPNFMERHGLAVAHSMAINRDGAIPVQMLNPGNSSIALHNGEKLGRFVPLEGPYGVHVVEASQGRISACEKDREVGPEIIESLIMGVEGLSDIELEQLRMLLCQLSSIISTSDSDIGRTRLVQHHIDTQGANPVKQPPRRLPFHRREEVKRMLNDMLAQGVIEPATGPWSSPVVLVQKKDGSTRFCVDFHQLNSLTKKDAHPLPRVDDTLDSLSGAQWFCTIDLASGYWQVEVAEEDKEKTAFSTTFGLFQFRTMPFGLCNAPSTFQRLMERVLTGLHWSTCLVYIDDIILFSRTVQEHFQNLTEVFRRLKQAGLKLKPRKCHLFRNKVKYLGYVVSNKGVEADTEKIQCVLDWPTPMSRKQIRQFWGLASYYRRFIHNFAQITAPLNRLLEKGKRWQWTEQCSQAFTLLKTKLTSAPLLVYPNFEEAFIVDCDASDDGLGTALSQNHQGAEYVVYYASRTLTKAERKYCATRKEMLALVWAIDQFRPYLYGRPFIVRTDHYALQWLRSFKEPEGQVARWLERLEEYEFTVQHRPELHDAPTGGHLGVAKVLEKAQQRFYWVGQRQDVEEWCRTCTTCGAQKSPAKHRRAPMEVDTVTDGPMQRIAMDILGPLPLTPRSNKYILVIGDYFTKWTEAFPMSDMEAGTVAKLFVNEFVVRYGAPACLHTDQGRNFESNLVKEICRLLGIVKTRTTPYHPQSDGMIERFNRTLLSMLKRAIIDAKRDWDLKLPCLMMAYRTSIHETTKATPFSLMFGREVQLPIDIMFGKPLSVPTTSTSEYARALEQRLVAAYEHVREHLGIEQRRHKQLYDRKGHSKKLHAIGKAPILLQKYLDDETMPDESGHEEHSLDETTENEALIQDRSTDETSQYEEVLVEREDDTLVRQLNLTCCKEWNMVLKVN